ncbi:hypothetical protein F2Q69_00006917 [Brassica cretica]|uniref:Uncharacterized protein n=1 Tax=Brassica cretica TaxID=69181 RepID=A0A8S9NXE2_BRACR|nr:hypothetical protein F2Q69_00006917 [Brassica cretica]
MADEKFDPHLRSILKGKGIDAIYNLWGVDYAVELELPDGKTLETVRPGYCVAYMSHFEDGGLSFPLPRFLLELFVIKRNNGFPGTMMLAPRASRSIIDGIPNRDDRWREKFFVFKINPKSVGDFDFSRIPREWSDEIEPFGSSPMTFELRGLIATLRRGNPRWLAFTVERIRAAYALPPGKNCATPIGLAAPVRPGKGRQNKKVLLDRPHASSEAESSERARKARRGPVQRSRPHAQSPGLMVRPISIVVPADGARVTPNISAGLIGDRSRVRVPGEGTSQVDPSARFPNVPEVSALAFSYDNDVLILEDPKCLASIWRKIRTSGCELPTLEQMREPGAHILMAVANTKVSYLAIASEISLRGELEAVRVKGQQCEVEVEELKGNLAAAEVEKVAIQNDLGLVKEKHRREFESRDVAARKECHLARHSLARQYDSVLAVVRGKLQAKKKETAAGGASSDQSFDRVQ